MYLFVSVCVWVCGCVNVGPYVCVLHRINEDGSISLRVRGSGSGMQISICEHPRQFFFEALLASTKFPRMGESRMAVQWVTLPLPFNGNNELEPK